MCEPNVDARGLTLTSLNFNRYEHFKFQNVMGCVMQATLQGNSAMALSEPSFHLVPVIAEAVYLSGEVAGVAFAHTCLLGGLDLPSGKPLTCERAR